MKKIIASIVAVALVMPFMASAATCSDPGVSCANGSPENVVSIWGFTNSQLPHVVAGAKAADGSLCPLWFAQTLTYCVDISSTQYYKSL